MAERDPEFLATYEKEEDWAEAHGISQRTAKRYRALPNGLPFLVFGGWVWIPKDLAVSGSRAAYSGAIPAPTVAKPAPREAKALLLTVMISAHMIQLRPLYRLPP